MLQLRSLAASASILGVLLGAGPGGAAPVSEKRFKFTKDFKRAFEAVVPKKTACGVLVVPDVPATSYYGAVYDELFGVELLFVPSLDRMELTASDVQPVLSYVEKTMKLFPDSGKARSFALARITHKAPKTPAKKPRQP